PALDHAGCDGFQDVPGAAQHGVDRVVPRLPVRALVEDRHDPRVGHGDVDVAQFGNARRVDALHRVEIANIGDVGVDAPTCLLDEPPGLIEVLGCGHRIENGVDLPADVEPDDVGALFGQPD